jgi:penicillin-binding protein 2
MTLDKLFKGITGRLAGMIACFALVAGLLVFRLWYEQLRLGTAHSKAIAQQSLRRIRVAPQRGRILDRNGAALTENLPSYDVYFHPHEMRRPRLTRTRRTVTHIIRQLDRIAELAGTDHEYGRADIAQMLQQTNTEIIMARGLASERLIEIRETLHSVDGIVFDIEGGRIRLLPDFMWLKHQSSRAHTIEFILSQIDLVQRLTGREHDTTYAELKQHLSWYPALPFRAFNNLDERDHARLMEQMPVIPGLEITTNVIRRYPHGEVAAHLVGYANLRYPSKDDLKKFAYYLPELTGRAGIEKTLNATLQGQGGYREVRVDSVGYFHDDAVDPHPPVAGYDVELTIDMRAQKIAHNLLRETKGAMVVLDCNSGAIRAMVSTPSYDLNNIRHIYTDLEEAPDKPLLNRALAAGFSPGSIVKPLIALAALEAQIQTPTDSVDCPGAYTFGDGTRIRCGRLAGHGMIDIISAIEMSCNTFFVDLGVRTELDRLQPLLIAAGIGQAPGTVLDDKSRIGRLPDRQRYHDETGRNWTAYDTAVISIGQGYISLSPLQAAVYTAAIANGGKVYKPYLVNGIKNRGEYRDLKNPEIRARLPVSQAHLAVVREGMRRVVHGERATGYTARVAMFESGGKTGSAQVGTRANRTVNVWFVCFAPFENPEYAIAVMLPDRPRNHSGGKHAAPVVKKFLEQYLSAH